MFYNPLLSNYQQLIFNICTFVFTQPVKQTAIDSLLKYLHMFYRYSKCFVFLFYFSFNIDYNID